MAGPVAQYFRQYGMRGVPLHVGMLSMYAGMLFYTSNALTPKRNWSHESSQNLVRAVYTIGELPTYLPLIPKARPERLGSCRLSGVSCLTEPFATEERNNLEHIIDELQGKPGTLSDYSPGTVLSTAQRENAYGALGNMRFPWLTRDRGNPFNLVYAAGAYFGARVLKMLAHRRRTKNCLHRTHEH